MHKLEKIIEKNTVGVSFREQLTQLLLEWMPSLRGRNLMIADGITANWMVADLMAYSKLIEPFTISKGFYYSGMYI